MTDLITQALHGLVDAVSFIAVAIGLVVAMLVALVLFLIIRLSSANARAEERLRQEGQRERPPLDPRGQLVGVACVVCGKPCMTVLSAAWCDCCEGALHNDCRAAHLSEQRSAYR